MVPLCYPWVTFVLTTGPWWIHSEPWDTDGMPCGTMSRHVLTTDLLQSPSHYDISKCTERYRDRARHHVSYKQTSDLFPDKAVFIVDICTYSQNCHCSKQVNTVFSRFSFCRDGSNDVDEWGDCAISTITNIVVKYPGRLQLYIST